MATYDFSIQLKHRTGAEFTTASAGLGNLAGLWTEPADYHKPIQTGTLFQLLLLYTVDRRAQQRPPPNNVLSEEEKRDRFALANQVASNPPSLELGARDVELLKLATSVLGVEPNMLCREFLENPKI